MNDLNEQSLFALFEEIRRVDKRPLAIKPTHAIVHICPTCGSMARYDEPYLMCDHCGRVIGQLLP